MPEDCPLSIMDNYAPDTTLWRAGNHLICEIQEHPYLNTGITISRRTLSLKLWSKLFGGSRMGAIYSIRRAVERGWRRSYVSISLPQTLFDRRAPDRSQAEIGLQ